MSEVPPVMPIRVIIFDFGNVLGFFSHDLACRQIAELSRSSATADQVRDWIFGSGRHIQLETGHLEPQTFLRDIQHEFAPRATIPEIRSAYSSIFQPNAAVCDSIPQIPAHFPIYLASNTDAIHWEVIAKQFEKPLSRFSGFVKSFEVEARKPALQFYERLIARTGFRAHDCLFVDDLGDNVAAAITLGMQGIVYSPQVDLAVQLRNHGIHVMDPLRSA